MVEADGDDADAEEAWQEFVSTLRAVVGNSTDPLGMVLRSHLWVERELTGLVRRGLPQPDALDLQRMPFSQLLNLAQALRVVRDDLVPSLVELNKLRNRIAHNVDAEPGERDQERLWHALPEQRRGHLDQTAEPDDTVFPGRLRHVLMGLAAFLYLDRESLTAYQIEDRRQWRENYERLQSLKARLRQDRAAP